jgi:hypothetical protein
MIKHFLISLGKAAIKLAIDKALEKALPKIYEKLDTRIPTALFNGASEQIVKSEFEHVIGQVTGKPVTKDVLDLVITLYDPIKNAKRIQRRPR